MSRIDILKQRKQKIVEGSGPEEKKRLFYDKGMFPPRERIGMVTDGDGNGQ